MTGTAAARAAAGQTPTPAPTPTPASSPVPAPGTASAPSGAITGGLWSAAQAAGQGNPPSSSHSGTGVGSRNKWEYDGTAESLRGLADQGNAVAKQYYAGGYGRGDGGAGIVVGFVNAVTCGLAESTDVWNKAEEAIGRAVQNQGSYTIGQWIGGFLGGAMFGYWFGQAAREVLNNIIPGAATGGVPAMAGGGSGSALGGALGVSAELQLGLATAAGTVAAGVAVQQASGNQGSSGLPNSGGGGEENTENNADGTNKNGSKEIDDIINGLDETTNGKGVARNFESSGGFDQTLRDFDSMNPLAVKDISTQYGSGKVGKLSDGTTVVARPGSETGGATLEIRVSNNKVFKIRY